MADEKPEEQLAEQQQSTGQQQASGFDMNKSTIVALLYLASFIVGVTGLVGFIMALVWKGEVAGTWEESHLQYHIMSFLIGLIGGVIGFILMFVLIGFLILPVVAVWVVVRTVIALLKAQKQEPMPDPKTLLF